MTLPFGLGELRVAQPLVLLALLALPLFLVGAGGRRGWRIAACCRALAAAALVAVLAGARLERPQPEEGACVVAAIDRSASVEEAGIEAARGFLGALLGAASAQDVVGSVVFGATAHVLARPAAAPPLASLLPEGGTGGVETGDTDLAAALAGAAPLCPESKQSALVLFTDGNETAGSLLAEAALTAPRMPVFAVVPPPQAFRPLVVRRLLAPTLAPEHGVLPLELVVENRTATRLTAGLKITSNGRPLGDDMGKSARLHFAEVPPGVSAVPLPFRVREQGQTLLEADILATPEEPPPPAPARATVTVTGPVRALVVTERVAPVVAAALVDRGVHVDAVAAHALGATALAAYHVVVLDDVGHAALDDRALDALATWVDAGGALVATGGEHLFGDPGFVGTGLERVLPVTFQSQRPEPKEREPIALYLLIDRSNSMGFSSTGVQYGEKMEYAKRAALAVLEQLGDNDLVGAIAFDAEPYELGPLVPVGEGRAALAGRIAQLRYGGGTDFKAALEIAHDDLRTADRRVRHVILLTDGDTNRRTEDHYALIDALARDGITVTAIRIGTDAGNLELLDAISVATGGEFHHVERVQALPQLMISDTRRMIDTAAGRQGAAVHLGAPGPMLTGLAEKDLPAVARWAIVRPKPGAEVRLFVDADERRDPILVTWQYGLGRVAVLPLDFQAGAAGWAAWGGFGKLWAQLVGWARPRGLPGDVHLVAESGAAGTLVRAETVGDVDGPLTLRLEDGGEIALQPSGRRTFSGFLGALTPGAHAATLETRRGSERIDLVVPAPGPSRRELRAHGPNLRLLEQVAALTGGRVGPAPLDVLQARPGVRRRIVGLDVLLVPLALLLVLADVAARRFAR